MAKKQVTNGETDKGETHERIYQILWLKNNLIEAQLH